MDASTLGPADAGCVPIVSEVEAPPSGNLREGLQNESGPTAQSPKAASGRMIAVRTLPLLLAALASVAPLAACGEGVVPDRAPFEPPLTRPPLEPPLDITGGFGEYRVGHFHAGLDFGTGKRVGRPVLAPLSGSIERVRSSGVGYGRSLYLRGNDGRLLVFGHLDAYAAPIDAYVRAAQDSSGQYEQDLWPAAGRFRVVAGRTIAWTGESGAGGPHLHFEIRRGDVAYHPQRAGLVAPDERPPSIASVTLEPLDDASRVAGSSAPYTVALGAAAETVTAIGRLRAIVAARDGVWSGVDRMVPWSIALSFEDERVECRFDSVSWATEMPEGDVVYDAGRIVGEKGIVLWGAPEFRPHMIRSRAPEGRETGTIVVRATDPPRTLRLEAFDVAGHVAEQRVVLVPPRPGASSRASAQAGGTPGGLRIASLPGGFLRVAIGASGAGESDARVRLVGRDSIERAATTNGRTWSAVLPVPRWALDPSGCVIEFRSRDAKGAARREAQAGRLVRLEAGGGMIELPGAAWRLEPGGSFEHVVVLAKTTNDRSAAAGLVPVPGALTIAPAEVPLRRAARVRIARPPDAPPRVKLYRRGDEGWEFVASGLDSSGRWIEGESRRLGAFRLFADTLAPSVAEPIVASAAAKAPYSRWALEARVGDEGSGIDGRSSWFEIDARRHPTEWDSENGVVRWRPARKPASGAHRYLLVVQDRVGNIRLRDGSFRVK